MTFFSPDDLYALIRVSPRSIQLLYQHAEIAIENVRKEKADEIEFLKGILRKDGRFPFQCLSLLFL